MYLLACSPVLAYIFNKAAKKGYVLKTCLRYASLFIGVFDNEIRSYVFCRFDRKNCLEWVFFRVGLLSVGEIFIGGFGLAIAARLVPQRLVGVMMGVWFMSNALTMVLGGYAK